MQYPNFETQITACQTIMKIFPHCFTTFPIFNFAAFTPVSNALCNT